MRLSKELLAALGAVCVTTGLAMAGEPADVQAYAHPTLFGTQAQTLVNTDSNVIIGGKVYKPCTAKTMESKQNVVIARCTKEMLEKMKSKMDAKRAGLFNTKIEQYTEDNKSVFRLKNENQTSTLKIIYPGLAKVLIQIIHEGLNTPENQEMTLPLNQIDQKVLVSIVESFIKEFKSTL